MRLKCRLSTKEIVLRDSSPIPDPTLRNVFLSLDISHSTGKEAYLNWVWYHVYYDRVCLDFLLYNCDQTNIGSLANEHPTCDRAFIAGGIAACGAVTVTHSFETVKIRCANPEPPKAFDT